MLTEADEVHSKLLLHNIRDAYLIQPFETNGEKRARAIALKYDDLHVLKDDYGWFLSKKQLNKDDVRTETQYL